MILFQELDDLGGRIDNLMLLVQLRNNFGNPLSFLHPLVPLAYQLLEEVAVGAGLPC